MKHGIVHSFKELSDSLSRQQHGSKHYKPALLSAVNAIDDYSLADISNSLSHTNSAVETNILGWAYLKRAEDIVLQHNIAIFQKEKATLTNSEMMAVQHETDVEMKTMSMAFALREAALASGDKKGGMPGLRYISDHYDMLDANPETQNRSIIGSIRSALKL